MSGFPAESPLFVKMFVRMLEYVIFVSIIQILKKKPCLTDGVLYTCTNEKNPWKVLFIIRKIDYNNFEYHPPSAGARKGLNTKMAKNRVKLNICGTECTVSTDDTEAYVLNIGDEVEKFMKSMMERNSRVSITMAATITALTYCDDMRKALAAADNLRSQIKDYLEDSSRSRLEADEARREIERMKKEIQTLRTRLVSEEADRETREARAAEQAAREASLAQSHIQPVVEDKPVEAVADEQGFQVFRAIDEPEAEKAEDVDSDGFMSFFEKKETD